MAGVALCDAFISIMPATMAGAVATLLNALVRYIPNQFRWTGFVDAMQPLIGVNAQVWTGSLAVLGLIFSFTFGYQLSVQWRVEPITGGIVTLGTFLMNLPQGYKVQLTESLSKKSMDIITACGAAVDKASISGWGFFNFNSFFGAAGFFTVMIMGGLAAAIYIWLMHQNITIRMPDSVPPAIAAAFTDIIPATVALYVSGLITWLVTKFGATTVIELISKTIQEPLLNLSQGYGAVLLMTVLVQVFWFFGLHGTNVLGPVLDGIWLTTQVANINTFAQHKDLPYMWTRNAFDLYAWIGGAGSTLLLLIAILMFSKRDDQRAVAKLAIAPGFFNVNEPVMFGMPIVLDPIYFIPFILAPVVMVTVAYFAITAGLVSPIKVQFAWSMPPILNALVGTLDWRAPILQVVNMAIGFLIYLPFVKAANRIKPVELEG